MKSRPNLEAEQVVQCVEAVEAVPLLKTNDATYDYNHIQSMSLKGVVEFVINIESYYIIEYPYQGLFSFNTSIYQLKEGRKVTLL